MEWCAQHTLHGLFDPPLEESESSSLQAVNTCKVLFNKDLCCAQGRGGAGKGPSLCLHDLSAPARLCEALLILP